MRDETPQKRSESSSREPIRIHLASLGCAKNLVDSERLLGHLASAGALVGAAADEADVVIVNTCGFIEPAIDESLTTISDYVELKKEKPDLRLFAMGCLVERSEQALRSALPGVDGFFGLHQQEELVAACGLRFETGEAGRLLLTPGHSAYLRISEGCDNCCAYCTIPFIRGPFRSREPDAILREARDLVSGGVRELNLIGQDTTSYGRDLNGGPAIHELIARLAEIKDLRWLRLLYAHPAHFPDDLIEAFATIECLVPYIDLPLQHTNDEILHRMGRLATRSESIHLIERLRERVPGVAVRTTFIVGFPGETRAQFRELVDDVERLRFDHLGVFTYSREQGTRAAEMPEQVSERTKKRRQEELMLAQQEIAFAKNRSMLGRVVEVLIDGPTEDPEVWIGRTATQAPDVDSVTLVHASAEQPDGLATGRFVDAQIVDVAAYDLIAQA